jgi:RNA polymerase sigma-70 factor (ECF subfamily)
MYTRAVPTDLEAARAGDHAAFARLIEPYRRELRAHCYRMAGTIHDADDLLQESLVRAWRGLASFEGRASLRTWLYKVTTHACLDKLDTASERAARATRELVEPCPPELYDTDSSPEQRITARESIALAFMVAMQLLTAKQRAVLILRDVIGMEASECAELLDLSVAAVNSALQRAREAVGEPAASVPDRDPDRDAVVARYLQAWERADSSALIGLLRDDARLAMPPMPDTYVGAAAIGAAIAEMVFAPAGAGAFKFVAIEASGEPALALYERGADGRFHAHAIQFLQIRGGLVADILAFVDPTLFGRLGVPTTIA